MQLTAMFHIATCGEHPAIPDHLSEECKAFLGRCFAQLPDDRASAAELLHDPWITRARPSEASHVGFHFDAHLPCLVTLYRNSIIWALCFCVS
jgi:serine/threonine protein kinase